MIISDLSAIITIVSFFFFLVLSLLLIDTYIIIVIVVCGHGVLLCCPVWSQTDPTQVILPS